MSCRQNMHKGRIKGNYKRCARKNGAYTDALIGVLFEVCLRLAIAIFIFWWMIVPNL